MDEEHELGRALQRHPWSASGGLAFVWLAMGVPWVVLLFRFRYDDAGDYVGATAISIFVFGLLGFLTWTNYVSRNDMVEVRAHGLVRFRRGVEERLRWDEIESFESVVTQKGVVTAHRHTVKGRGLTWVFTQMFADIEALAAKIEANLVRLIVEEAMPRIRSGGVVDFGAYTVTKKGIEKGDRSIAWDELGEIEVDDDKAIVHQKDVKKSWASVVVGRRNALALYAIAKLRPDVEATYR